MNFRRAKDLVTNEIIFINLDNVTYIKEYKPDGRNALIAFVDGTTNVVQLMENIK